MNILVGFFVVALCLICLGTAIGSFIEVVCIRHDERHNRPATPYVKLAQKLAAGKITYDEYEKRITKLEQKPARLESNQRPVG